MTEAATGYPGLGQEEEDEKDSFTWRCLAVWLYPVREATVHLVEDTR